MATLIPDNGGQGEQASRPSSCSDAYYSFSRCGHAGTYNCRQGISAFRLKEKKDAAQFRDSSYFVVIG
jgi:hypothetical protein